LGFAAVAARQLGLHVDTAVNSSRARLLGASRLATVPVIALALEQIEHLPAPCGPWRAHRSGLRNCWPPARPASRSLTIPPARRAHRLQTSFIVCNVGFLAAALKRWSQAQRAIRSSLLHPAHSPGPAQLVRRQSGRRDRALWQAQAAGALRLKFSKAGKQARREGPSRAGSKGPREAGCEEGVGAVLGSTSGRGFKSPTETESLVPSGPGGVAERWLAQIQAGSCAPLRACIASMQAPRLESHRSQVLDHPGLGDPARSVEVREARCRVNENVVHGQGRTNQLMLPDTACDEARHKKCRLAACVKGRRTGRSDGQSSRGRPRCCYVSIFLAELVAWLRDSGSVDSPHQ